jgi:hypothetical protein
MGILEKGLIFYYSPVLITPGDWHSLTTSALNTSQGKAA